MDTQEREHLYGQFSKRQTGMLIVSILFIVLGAGSLFFGGVGTVGQILKGTCGWFLIISGLGMTGLGVWGITFSRKREIEIPVYGIVVYETKLGLIIAWIAWGIGMIFAVVSFLMACCDESACWIPGICALIFLFGCIVCFSDYRQRRIIVSETIIAGATAFGKAYSYSKSEVYSLKLSESKGGYIACSADGKKIFGFENNMVHAEELYRELSGDRFAGWQEAGEKVIAQLEVDWNPEDETWQTEHVKGIKKGLYCLFAVNVLLIIFLLFLCPNTVMKFKYRLLVVELQPLSFIIYGWIFSDVIKWTGAADNSVTREWKEKHISMAPAYIFIFINLLLVTTILFTKVNLIAGESHLYVLMGILTAVLWGITVLRTPKIPFRKLTLGIHLFVVLVLSMGIVYGMVLVFARPAEYTHYPAQIVKTSVSRGKSTSYYATVILADSRKKSVEVTHSTYEDIEHGKQKVVCENESIWGMRFVTLHDPVQ